MSVQYIHTVLTNVTPVQTQFFKLLHFILIMNSGQAKQTHRAPLSWKAVLRIGRMFIFSSRGHMSVHKTPQWKCVYEHKKWLNFQCWIWRLEQRWQSSNVESDLLLDVLNCTSALFWNDGSNWLIGGIYWTNADGYTCTLYTAQALFWSTPCSNHLSGFA